MFLVDTNVLSELMRPRPSPAVSEWASRLEQMHLSVVTVEEIHFGLAAKQAFRLQDWFEGFLANHATVLPVTLAVARRAGAMRALRRSAGRPQTQADALIAATAAEHNLVVATRNRRDFEGLGVRVFDPFPGRR